MQQGAGVMNRNRLIEILCSLIVIAIVIMGWRFYEIKALAEENIETYALSTYNIDISGFTYVNSIIENNKVYLLYQNGNYYILKEIDTTTSQESNYSYTIAGTCQLQKENSYPYIYCTNSNSISIYDVHFQNILTQSIKSNYNYALNTSGNLNFRIIDNTKSYEYINGYYENTSNSYVSLDSPYVLEAYCADECLLVRYNNLTENTSLYQEDELLETNIYAYQRYNNGILTYSNNKIKIYNAITDEYKEFYSSINSLLTKTFALGTNDYYLYILNDKTIDVYNLYTENNITSIDITKVTEEISKILIEDSKLYLYGTNTIYVYDIADLESNISSSESNYGNNYIDSQIAYYENTYGVTINITDNPNSLTNDYSIKKATNNNDIISSLNDLEKYFTVFNKNFFSRFSEYGMSGLEIYLVNNITAINRSTGNAEVVGLYINKNNKYNLVLRINSGEEMLNIAYHETFHAIEDYLRKRGITFSGWNKLNPEGFSYSNVYYTNQEFTDTLGNNKYNNNIYFVDNYARSNEIEDRARTFEYICHGEDFSAYNHLSAKVRYIKKILLSYFPELYSSSYFI